MHVPQTAPLVRCSYLTELQHHPNQIAEDPEAWMPWNYREARGHAGTTTARG